MVKKTIFFIALLFGFQPVMAANPNELVEQANMAYVDGQYSYAIEIYEALLEQKLEASELYYNLGNAYFKENRLGPAILNYERALKIKPGDENTLFNLEVARARTVDHINPVPLIFYENWWRSFYSFFGTDAWARLGLLFLVFSLIFLGGFFFFHTRGLKKLGFGLALFSLLLMSISFLAARTQYHNAFKKREAIVMTPRATAKSSPGESSPDLFVIHEGSKARITGELGEWYEIRLANGNVGWVKKTALEMI
jgi:tetratricopeptide (TPR) repeat protein